MTLLRRHVTFSEHDELAPSVRRETEAGLYEHARALQLPPRAVRPLVVLAHDEASQLIGALSGKTFWACFEISLLWVSPERRGEEIGSLLLSRAEAIARARKCHTAVVDTLSFQAPDFYRKHGFEEIFRLREILPGHDRIYLNKRLDG